MCPTEMNILRKHFGKPYEADTKTKTYYKLATSKKYTGTLNMEEMPEKPDWERG